MQAVVIVRRADMKPVLECWEHELNGRVVKPEFLGMTTLQWLQGFNAAVQVAGGVQPSPDQLRAQFGV